MILKIMLPVLSFLIMLFSQDHKDYQYLHRKRRVARSKSRSVMASSA